MKYVLPRTIEPSWPEFVFTFQGARIRTRDAVKLPDDVLAVCYFVGPKGTKVWPWKNAGHYVDDDGEALAPVGAAMARDALEGLGMTDATLDKEHRRLFGEPSGVDTKGLDSGPNQIARRAAYDRVMAEIYG
jgi:hypothetical protein